MTLDISLAVLNCILCLWRSLVTLRSGRLISIAWFLITYFAIFFLPVAVTNEVSWFRGFPGEWVKAEHDTIHKVIIYVLVFNLIFACTEMLFSRLLIRQDGVTTRWQLELDNSHWRTMFVLLISFWLVGGTWYIWQTRSSTYRDYVEGASWALVFFWASSPLIALAAMRKHWLLASVLCLPFLYFAVHLAVRSFALLSLVPLLVVGFFQVEGNQALGDRFWKMLRYMVLAGALLVGVSIFISQYKTGGISFPDSGMPFGFVETAAMVDRFDKHVGFASLQLYGWNYINPFMRLFGIDHPKILDTPVVIAGLLDGVPENWPVYYHYPALLWTDAYISFGWMGLSLAVFWAMVLCIWEWVMNRNPLLLSLLLPFFCWHCYLLVRGAIAVASVPLAYAGYFSLMAYWLAFRSNLFRKISMQDAAVLGQSVQPDSRLSNLMT